MKPSYHVLKVTVSAKESIEQMGTKLKFWLMDARTRKLWLFKYGRKTTGEDWSEKIAAEVAEALEIPHAVTELGVCEGCRGILSLDFTEQGSRGSLVHGNELLAAIISNYPKDQKFRASQHTVANIVRAIDLPDVGVPPGVPAGIATPVDLFLGYLMLDALIGNTDRHHENWGLLVKAAPDSLGHAELAPTFDHASSLGRELSEDAKQNWLTGSHGKDIGIYARRGRARSAVYASSDDPRPLTTLDAFLSLAKMRPSAYATWRDRLAMLLDDRLYEIVHRVPKEFMSPVSKEFAFRLLVCNKTRVVEASIETK